MAWRAQLGRQLRELRVCLATQGDGTSQGAVDFLRRRACEFKMLNPGFPFYVREGDRIDPYIVAEFDWGETAVHDISGKSAQEIDDMLKNIVTSTAKDSSYQKQREHRPPVWLRLPPDVVDEIGKPCEAIPRKLPPINNWSPETGISPPGRQVVPPEVLAKVDADLKAIEAKLGKEHREKSEREAKRAKVAAELAAGQ